MNNNSIDVSNDIKRCFCEGRTILCLVRHGESVGNKNRVCLGHTDLDLTDKGREQAEMTAKELSDVKFAEIYSSDLIRAMNTARPHAEMRNMSVIPSVQLRELYFGKWENASIDYLLENYHDEFVIGWRGSFGTYTPPDGEYVQDMARRIEQELCRIASKNVGSNVLVVSHAAAIRALWGRISGIPKEQVAAAVNFPSNASYSVVEYISGSEGERLVPLYYSCDKHLADMITVIPKV